MGPKIPKLSVFGLEFENIIVMVQISILEFVLLQSVVQKNKSLNLERKMPYFRIFGLELEKIVIFEKLS